MDLPNYRYPDYPNETSNGLTRNVYSSMPEASANAYDAVNRSIKERMLHQSTKNQEIRDPPDITVYKAPGGDSRNSESYSHGLGMWDDRNMSSSHKEVSASHSRNFNSQETYDNSCNQTHEFSSRTSDGCNSRRREDMLSRDDFQYSRNNNNSNFHSSSVLNSPSHSERYIKKEWNSYENSKGIGSGYTERSTSLCPPPPPIINKSIMLSLSPKSAVLPPHNSIEYREKRMAAYASDCSYSNQTINNAYSGPKQYGPEMAAEPSNLTNNSSLKVNSGPSNPFPFIPPAINNYNRDSRTPYDSFHSESHFNSPSEFHQDIKFQKPAFQNSHQEALPFPAPLREPPPFPAPTNIPIPAEEPLPFPVPTNIPIPAEEPLPFPVPTKAPFPSHSINQRDYPPSLRHLSLNYDAGSSGWNSLLAKSENDHSGRRGSGKLRGSGRREVNSRRFPSNPQTPRAPTTKLSHDDASHLYEEDDWDSDDPIEGPAFNKRPGYTAPAHIQRVRAARRGIHRFGEIRTKVAAKTSIKYASHMLEILEPHINGENKECSEMLVESMANLRKLSLLTHFVEDGDLYSEQYKRYYQLEADKKAMANEKRRLHREKHPKPPKTLKKSKLKKLRKKASTS